MPEPSFIQPEAPVAAQVPPSIPVETVLPTEGEGENIMPPMRRMVPTEEETVIMERRRERASGSRNYFPRGIPHDWLAHFGREMSHGGFPIEFTRLVHDNIMVSILSFLLIFRRSLLSF